MAIIGYRLTATILSSRWSPMISSARSSPFAPGFGGLPQPRRRLYPLRPIWPARFSPIDPAIFHFSRS